MKLNGYEVVDTTEQFTGDIRFDLKCTMAEALALDGQRLTITDDAGEVQRVLIGYGISSIGPVGDGVTRAWFARVYKDDTAASLAQLATDVSDVKATVAKLAEKIGVEADA